MKCIDKVGIYVIKRTYATVEGKRVEYSLLSLGAGLRPVYAIEIKDRDESRMSFFGINRKRAIMIYDTIVKNTVTPCTLEDIAEDMAHQ